MSFQIGYNIKTGVLENFGSRKNRESRNTRSPKCALTALLSLILTIHQIKIRPQSINMGSPLTYSFLTEKTTCMIYSLLMLVWSPLTTQHRIQETG